jgi:hypothetical protein
MRVNDYGRGNELEDEQFTVLQGCYWLYCTVQSFPTSSEESGYFEVEGR